MPPVMQAEDPETAGFESESASADPTTLSGVPEVSDSEKTGEFESAFFTITDEEMKEHDRDARRRERTEKREGRNPWKIVLGVLLVIAVLGGALVAAFFFGLGYPTQGMVVSGMLDAKADLESVESYWVAVPSSDVEKEMAKIPPMSEYTIESVERSPRTSLVVVIVTPESGTPLTYEITLAREGVGWKVSGVEILL